MGAAFPARYLIYGIIYVMSVVKTIALFIATALAEIVGCYLPYLWLRKAKPLWLLAPAAVSLALFAWLLTLHPASGWPNLRELRRRLRRHRALLALADRRATPRSLRRARWNDRDRRDGDHRVRSEERVGPLRPNPGR
jgi:hypothetical protein